MEVLGFFIVEKCEAKLWNSIKAMQGVIPFSHVFFIGDIVLFVKIDWKNCIFVRDVLDSFCALSSKKISSINFWVFFSPNVLIQDREGFCDIGLSLYP